MDTTGTITNFASAPHSIIDIGGTPFEVQTAGQSYSLTNPDPQTLQFQIQPGDHAWFDGSNVDRSELDGSEGGYIQPNTPVAINYQFMVQPNGSNGSFTNTASWFVAGEMHNDDTASGVATSPPFAIQLDGDHLQVVARYAAPGVNPSNAAGQLTMMTLWTDPNPIQTNQYNNISIKANVSNTSAGYLDVSVNGTQVVNYSGPLGYGSPTYWEEGLYRNSGPTESATADFRNLTLLTGSAATAANSGGATSSGGTSTSGSTSGTTTTTGSASGTGTTVTNPTGTSGSSTTSTSGGTPASGGTSGTTTTTGSASGTGTTVTDPTGTSGSSTTSTSGGTPTSSGGTSGTTTTTGSASGTGTTVTDPTGTSGSSTTSTSGGTPTSSGGTSGTTTTTGSASGTGTTVTDPTGTSGSSTTSTSGSTPTAPTVTLANSSLQVSPGGNVPLGIDVNVPNAGDSVTVNISGMPGFESITDNLDHKTFSGNSVTLTAAQVDSGLTLNSSYRGHGRPTSTLSVTATDTTGTQISSAPQTIAVVDPSATADSSTGSARDWGSGSWSTANNGSPQSPSFTSPTSAGGPTTSSTTGFTSPTTPTSSDQSSQPGGFNLAQWFDHHPDFAPAATTLSEAGASGGGTGFEPPVATAPADGTGSRSFALFNQVMASNFSSASHFAQATTTSSAASPQSSGFLAAHPLH